MTKVVMKIGMTVGLTAVKNKTIRKKINWITATNGANGKEREGKENNWIKAG